MENQIYNQAKFYLEHKKSIIPVGKDKKPLINWKEYQSRLATQEELSNWFKLYPNMQIGIVTGKISDLIVVDIDDSKADLSWLPETMTAKTGSGGFHLYYTYSEDCSNKSRIKESIDIRGEGGYVVAPPSENEKGKYEWIKKIQTMPFPKNLFFKNETEYKPKDLIGTIYAGYGEGQRNEQLTKYIGHLLAKIHPSEWDTLGYQETQRANDKNTPPLSERELQNIFKSICGAERRNTKDRWYKAQEQQEKQQQVDKLLNGNDDDVVLISEATKKKYKAVDNFETGISLFDEAIDGGVNAGNLVVISAPSGAGKTTLAQTITCNLIKQGLPCLWFSYEVLLNDLWDKFQKMGLTEEDVCVVPFKNTTGRIDWIEKKIQEAKEKFFAHFIFIDHLGYLMPRLVNDKVDFNRVDNNYSRMLTEICRELKMIAIKEEVVIFLPVHMRKTDKPDINDIYFSIGIAQEADLVIGMQRENDLSEESTEYYTPYTEITILKNRKTGRTKKGWFTLENNKLIYDEFYKPIKKKGRL